MTNKPPLTRNPATVEFERAQADRDAVIKRLGRTMKWENPIRSEARRREMVRIEAVVTECTAVDKLPHFTSRVSVDWPIVYRNGNIFRPISARRVGKTGK